MNKEYAKVQSTRKSLILSVLSLMLCVAMLIGTTYAWFTDSVTSGRNKIVAGNLDIELEYLDSTGAWKPVTNTTKLFNDNALWEPGHTEVAYLKLSNKGTLDLKYNVAVNIDEEVEGTNVYGESFKLSDYLNMGVVEGQETAYATRDEARADVTDAGNIATYTKSGKMIAGVDADTVYMALVIFMPEEVDNHANYKTDTTAPSITMGIDVAATQLASEKDSFGDDYDKAAWLPWTGEEVSTEEFAENVDTDNKVVEIWQPEELAYWANHVSDYKNYTVNLMNDVDLAGKTWTPINGWNGAMNGITFDGNNHSIKNMVVYDDTAAGFIGMNASSVTIKNLTFDGAKVSTKANTNQTYAGVLMGKNYSTLTVENVNVKNSSVNNNWQCGGLIGYSEGCTVTFKNCSVEDSEFGGLNATAGTLFGLGKVDVNVENCTAKNVTLYTDSLTWNSTAKAKGNFWVGHLYTNTLTTTGTNPETNVNAVYFVDEGIALSNDGNTYSILNATGLVNFAADIDYAQSYGPRDTVKTAKYSGKVIKIANDIDLAGVDWKPIHLDYNDCGFSLTIDGQDHTIKNMKTDCDGAGFIAYTASINLTIKDLKFDGSYQTGNKQIGVVIGHMYGVVTLDNVDVTNATIVGTGANPIRFGTLIGHMDSEGLVTLNLNNCDISNCTISNGFHNIGGVIGTAGGGTTNIHATNCTITNCDLTGTCARADVWPNCVSEFACNGTNAYSMIEGITATNVTLHKPAAAG